MVGDRLQRNAVFMQRAARGYTRIGAFGEEMPSIELTVHSAPSPELSQALLKGTMDAAFLRPDKQARGLDFMPVTDEALYALLPARHRLAARKTITADFNTDAMAGHYISFLESLAHAVKPAAWPELERSCAMVPSAMSWP